MSGLNLHYFAHSWVSDWNHGNAHFLRGLARALLRAGNKVRCYEPLGSWSLYNLIQNESEKAVDAIDEFRRLYFDLDVQFYDPNAGLLPFLRHRLRQADAVIVHEWNDPEVVNAILSLKRKLGFVVLLHDTHHRAYTSAGEILRFRLDRFDGVLAFGEAVRRIYSDGFGIPRTWTFHEAADIENFRPLKSRKLTDLVWIGNWGDEERTRELEEFLMEPARALQDRRIAVYGVRYPMTALEQLDEAGIEYRGYLPNLAAPQAYAESRLALHVPRRQYANGLGGIPTIRVFEALACGIPLLCASWADVEGMFRPGEDYLVLSNGSAMRAEIDHMLGDAAARAQLAANGLQTIRARHTCAHRARQLMEILGELGR
jgi:spore maturation protein CgeB